MIDEDKWFTQVCVFLLAKGDEHVINDTLRKEIMQESSLMAFPSFSQKQNCAALGSGGALQRLFIISQPLSTLLYAAEAEAAHAT